ncbi:hypothetical protein AB0D66_33335 [Streptomyces sp. NPDC048270]|uniref:hypothetical protein n=1 Tax=Streptomyces sp. NPDC048270 TaxID=3154615 RepID=UPI00340CA0A4
MTVEFTKIRAVVTECFAQAVRHRNLESALAGSSLLDLFQDFEDSSRLTTAFEEGHALEELLFEFSVHVWVCVNYHEQFTENRALLRTIGEGSSVPFCLLTAMNNRARYLFLETPPQRVDAQLAHVRASVAGSVSRDGDSLVVTCPPEWFDAVEELLEATGTRESIVRGDALASQSGAPGRQGRIFFIGHGGYSVGGPLVRLPADNLLRFYALPDSDMQMSDGLALAHLVANGGTVERPVEVEVPNYRFRAPVELALEAHSLLGWEQLQMPGLHGLPESVPLCGADSGGCATGSHSCSGLLGLFAGTPMDVLACRTERGTENGADTSVLPPDLEDELYAITDEWILELRKDIAAGKPFDGGFRAWFDSLPPASLVLALRLEAVLSWRVAREVWSVPKRMTDPVALGSFIASGLDDLERSVALRGLTDPQRDRSLRYVFDGMGAPGRTAARGVHLFLARPDEFASFWSGLGNATDTEKSLMKRHPGIRGWAEKHRV